MFICREVSFFKAAGLVRDNRQRKALISERNLSLLVTLLPLRLFLQYLYGYFLRKYSVLATLIYRSRLNHALIPATGWASKAGKPTEYGVTGHRGVLLFDGRQFLQVLEGPISAVNAVFERINRDVRHATRRRIDA
jgi:hypothetical protein